jgi:23S rRNA (uridine2552-2'-O)-methyltransferase
MTKAPITKMPKVKSSIAKPSVAKPLNAKSSIAKSSIAKSSKTKPSNTKPSNTKPSAALEKKKPGVLKKTLTKKQQKANKVQAANRPPLVNPLPPKAPPPRKEHNAPDAPAMEVKIKSAGAQDKGIGARGLHVRIKKKAGTIKESSRRWLTRHMNDPYVHRSRAEGMRSRAAYKLTEINDRYKILKPGDRVIDLGAAPGGWCQIAATICASSDTAPSVVGIDFLEIAPLPGVKLLLMDFLDEAAPQAVLNAIDGPPDVVMSDMAAPTTGHRRTDHMRTMQLCEIAAQFAIDNLKPGGHFLSKTFQGGTENMILDLLKRNFRTVHHVKPPASRQESVELYILAKGFKGRGAPVVENEADFGQ